MNPAPPVMRNRMPHALPFVVIARPGYRAWAVPLEPYGGIRPAAAQTRGMGRWHRGRPDACAQLRRQPVVIG